MLKKFQFYERYGVEEYYLYNPALADLTGWQRCEGKLEVIDPVDSWVSPRLEVRFELSESELQIYRPDGERFLTYLELEQQRQQQQQRAEQAEANAAQQQQRAEQAEARAVQAETSLEQARQRSLILAEQLRSMGIDPEQL